MKTIATLTAEFEATRKAWKKTDCYDECVALEEKMDELQAQIDAASTGEVFERKNFQFHGGYLTYNRANGDNRFIARFKYSTAPIKQSDFKAALVGTSVDDYLAKLDAGVAPMKAAPGLMDRLEALVAAKRQGAA